MYLFCKNRILEMSKWEISVNLYSKYEFVIDVFKKSAFAKAKNK
ncbi:hypothetical protein DDD_2060 [Nonlabens dokdonensis DSW-6]|uniref:Uncharacterized protein n=1 Tax=Nonlabens dokdonensis (strain DSM 17205 / KCTC 12402 / DSW-6) TaxID=592029 RepID=L7WAE6_NONDD|nr:hypothetical protein DDD_2060 [Nonlabens dokdonensis DSW-6]